MKFTTALLAALPALAFAQIDSGQAVPITGAANPAISPDGNRIAFRYRGDVWIVPASGGSLTGAEVDELVDLYQRVSTHLSMVRTASSDSVLVGRLSG